MFASIFPADPWAKALDFLIGRGYADETKAGSIANLKSMDLESLVGTSGKIGLGYVNVIGREPTNDDIYAHWMRLAKLGNIVEIRVISNDTGLSGRWEMPTRWQTAFEHMEAEILAQNQRHTAARRAGGPRPNRPTDWLEFQLTPEQNPLYLAPSTELRFFLYAFYNKLGGSDLRRLSQQDATALATFVRDGLKQAANRR